MSATTAGTASALLAFGPMPDAAPVRSAGPSLPMVLLAAAVVIGAAQLGGLLAVRWRQPAVIGELVVVILIGPGALGTLMPGPSGALFTPSVLDVLQMLGGVGVVLFVFAVGVEIPRDLVRSVGTTGAVLGTSAFLLPAASGVLLGTVLARVAPGMGTETTEEVLFLGLAMGMTAFPVLARILDDVPGLTPRTRALGLSLAGCADALGWGGLVLLLSAASGDLLLGSARLLGVGFALAAVALVGRAAVRAVARWTSRNPSLVRIDAGVVLAIVFLSAAISELGGLHSVVGALVVSVALPRTEPMIALAGTLNIVACTLLLPMFFVTVSANVELSGLGEPAVLVLVVVVLVLAVGTKLLGTWLPARMLGLSASDGVRLGLMASCRGLTEIVVLDVGRQAGLVSGSVFTVFVVMSLIATLMTGPGLRFMTPCRDCCLDPDATAPPR